MVAAVRLGLCFFGASSQPQRYNQYRGASSHPQRYNQYRGGAKGFARWRQVPKQCRGILDRFAYIYARRTEPISACVACFVQAPADLQIDSRRARVTHAGQAHEVGWGGAAEIVWTGVYVRVQVSANNYLAVDKRLSVLLYLVLLLREVRSYGLC